MFKNYSDISQNKLIKEYYKKKETLETNLQKISLIVESFEEKSKLITEEIRLQEYIKHSHLQASIQHQDNLTLAQETNYLEERLKIIEKRQKIELGLLEKKFQWQHGVKQLQKKYNVSLENLKLDDSLNTDNINTYQKKINLSKETISWDHPPFNNNNPNYNSLNIPSKQKIENINNDILEINPIETPPEVPSLPENTTVCNKPAIINTSNIPKPPPLPKTQNVEPVAITSKPAVVEAVATEPVASVDTPPVSAKPVVASEPVASVTPHRETVSTESDKKEDFRSDNQSLEQQLRQAFQSKFSHLKENSDSESSDEF